MRSLALALCLVLQAGTAVALSCKPPNFGEDFNRIARAVDLYTVAYGTLRLAGALQSYERGQPREILFEFNGKFIGHRQQKLTREVLVRTECTGAWCGQVPPEDTPIVMFLKHENAGMSLASGPCIKDYFAAPSLGRVSAIRACLRKGLCGDAELDAFDMNR